MEIDSNFFKVESSGRINLIGEHTDHQLGFVLPVSINAKITFYGAKRNDNLILAYSESYNEKFTFTIENLENFKPVSGNWFNFIIGILKSLKGKFTIDSGCNIVISSSLPQGAGLSSSAALEVGLTSLFELIYNFKMEPLTLVKLCWKVENDFIGVKCGIMDQFIVKFGQKDTALKINCSDLSFEKVKVPQNMRILIIDTKIRHSLIDTPYNTRIEECFTALKKINSLGYNISNLSELTPSIFTKLSGKIKKPYSLRIKHIITENKRVNEFFSILQNSQSEGEEEMFKKLGNLLYESHKSLQFNFEASWDRADKIVEFCKGQETIYGARMVGGGWGGSVLVLVDESARDELTGILNRWFMDVFQDKTSISLYEISDGLQHQKIYRNEIPDIFEKFFLT